MNLATERSYSGEYLSNLLNGLREVDKENDILIKDLCLDSRKVGTGSLFFAIPGEVEDGRSHIQQAIQAGARAVVYESDGWSMEHQDDSRLIAVRDLRRQIGTVADVFYGKPSSKMHVVGITGTNGKSTCASLTAQALKHWGRNAGLWERWVQDFRLSCLKVH
jgi:UDP-N-acetylmuramoyl-L-alanyl-D-glutamate--2,6-diaminopimelate ligase